MGRNLKILLSIFVFVIFYAVYYFGLPALVNVPENFVLIEKTIQTQTGMKIQISNPKIKMGYIPSLIFYSDEVAILNNDDTKAFKCSKPYINIRLLPLIFKKIYIKELSADAITAYFVFDGDFKLGQYKIDNLPKSDFKLQRASVNLGDYDIYIEDKIQSKTNFFDGQYLVIKDFTDNKHIDLSTIADWTINDKKTSIQADIDLKLPIENISKDKVKMSGHIANLDLSDFSNYIDRLSNGKIKSTSGLINFVVKPSDFKNNLINIYLQAKNIGIFQDDIKTSIHSDEMIEISGDFEPIHNGIDIKDLKVKGKDINVTVLGLITKLNSKLPILDLKVGVTKSKAESIINLLPAEHNLVPDMDLYVLKKAGFWGDASAYLEIKGKADYPNIYGNVLVANAYMVQPIVNAEKATIKLAFIGDKFNLDVRVPTSPTQTVWVKGPINLDKEHSADLHITSTDNVDLKTAQIVLNPLHEVLHFDLGPVPIMDIKGHGGIDLRVVGTKQNPHAWGKFFFKNAIVSFLDINNLEVVNGTGALNFDNQNTMFVSDTAELNGRPISIKGTCSLYGDLNFDVASNNQNLGMLLKSIKTSPMLKDVDDMLYAIEDIKGNADVKLNLKGHVTDPNDIVFNKNIFAKGTIKLLSDTVKIADVPIEIEKTSGIINFNNTDADFNLVSKIGSSQIKTYGKINDNNCNLEVLSEKFNIVDGLRAFSIKIPYKEDLSSIYTNFKAKYVGKLDNIEYNKVNVKGMIHSNQNSRSKIIVNNSNFELANSNFKLSDLRGNFLNSPYQLNLQISKLFSNYPVYNGFGKFSDFDLSVLNDKNLKDILPDNMKEFANFEFISGKTDITARAKNNNFNVYTVFDNINILYKPQDVKFVLKSGNALLQNSILNINKINALVEDMPIFVNGKIYNVFKNPNLNLYLNVKPNQEFFDKFYNTKSIYPIKMKGDIILTSKINGTLDNIASKSILDISENSSLYYMGATIGDTENQVRITFDGNCYPYKVKVNNLQYDKVIMSQNNKPFVNTQLNASGMLTLLKDNNVGFNNFKIKTKNPTDAKIFNIIFRKPFMKQGVFTSDIILNGTSLAPKVLGILNITSIDIPFFDSTIRDINLDFKNDKINIATKGTVLANDVILNAVVRNKMQPPYVVESVQLKLADLNINKILDAVNDIEAESARNLSVSSQQGQVFDINQLIINKAEINANNIEVRNIKADNFYADVKLTNKHILDVKKFNFDIAQGVVNGKINYNLMSQKTDLDINLKDANAAIMSEAMFDLKGQIYGSIRGDFALTCTLGSECFKTLSGKGNFEIADGRMPKLGSLEYLLKAGNLWKSGLTGLSINGIVDLLTPLKTGDFESISGNINITDGIADDINIYSRGKDLNMYLKGKYDLSTSIADMKIFGSLSKNITTVFGKIKNASFNTLINTIPGVNDSNEKLLLQTDISKIPNINNATDIFRIFAVDVNGDINGNDYVKSFRWVK